MMKRIVIITGFILVNYFTYSQQTEERKLSSFDKVNVLSEVNVYMNKGTEENVKVSAYGIDLAEVETIINGKTLQIQLTRGVQKNAKIDIYVTYKEVRDLSVAAAGKISVQDTLKGDKVVLNAITNGEIDSELNLKTVDINIGQGGVVRLTGKVGSIDAKLSTGGILSAIDLQSDSTYVKVSSTGNAKVTANSLLDADVKTGGNLTYAGKPSQKNIKKGFGTTVTSIDE